MEKQNQTQQFVVDSFVVDSRTLGKLAGLGLISVLTDQDENGKVDVQELEGSNAGRVNEGVAANAIERISSKPGSAKGKGSNNEESELDMARRLAGRDRRPQNGQQRRDQEEYLYLGAKPYGTSIKAVYKHKDDTLSIRISRIDEREDLNDVPVTLLLLGKGSKKATDKRTGKTIAGKFYSYAEYEIVVGDGKQTTGTNE